MIKRFLAMLLVLGCFMVAWSIPAQAKDVFGNVCKSPGTSKSAVCSDPKAIIDPSQDPLSGKNGLFIKITNIVAYVGGAAAVIMIMVSALRFVTSGSDISTGARHDNDVENARRSIAGALIGLTVIVLARSIILFVLGKL